MFDKKIRVRKFASRSGTLYIRRHMETTLFELSQSFGAVLVTGARQSGKTTLLTRVFPEAAYTTFDDGIALNVARSDPESFLPANAEAPIILDEVQYAP